MRPIKIAGVLFALALLLSSLAASSASAAKPLAFLKFKAGLTFTGKGGPSELVDIANGSNIKCKKNTILLATSKITGEKTIETNIHFENCETVGFPVNSLGDATGVILVPLKGELCYFDKALTKPAILLKIPPLHLEVPALGQLIEIIKNGANESSVVGKLKEGQINTDKTGPWTLEITKPNQLFCFSEAAVEKKDDIVQENNHDGKPLLAEQSSPSEELTFDELIEIMG